MYEMIKPYENPSATSQHLGLIADAPVRNWSTDRQPSIPLTCDEQRNNNSSSGELLYDLNHVKRVQRADARAGYMLCNNHGQRNSTTGRRWRLGCDRWHTELSEAAPQHESCACAWLYDAMTKEGMERLQTVKQSMLTAVVVEIRTKYQCGSRPRSLSLHHMLRFHKPSSQCTIVRSPNMRYAKQTKMVSSEALDDCIADRFYG
jgi:hypothetical protein